MWSPNVREETSVLCEPIKNLQRLPTAAWKEKGEKWGPQRAAHYVKPVYFQGKRRVVTNWNLRVYLFRHLLSMAPANSHSIDCVKDSWDLYFMPTRSRRSCTMLMEMNRCMQGEIHMRRWLTVTLSVVLIMGKALSNLWYTEFRVQQSSHRTNEGFQRSMRQQKGDKEEVFHSSAQQEHHQEGGQMQIKWVETK